MELRLLRYFVAVVEERHFGRAAARLRIAQPSLSRAVRQLEHDLGATLLDRSPTGVDVTTAGSVLYDEACALLQQAERARMRVATVAGSTTLTVGALSDTVERYCMPSLAMFRERHPGVEVRVREADTTDPGVGLQAGLVDVAVTRVPFEHSGLGIRVLWSEPVAAMLRSDDPLASRDVLRLDDLADRRLFRFPDTTDAEWSAFWIGDRKDDDAPVVRVPRDCQRAVLWNGVVGIFPLAGDLPPGLTAVEIVDHPPSKVVVAWRRETTEPLVHSFVSIISASHSAPSRSRGAR